MDTKDQSQGFSRVGTQNKHGMKITAALVIGAKLLGFVRLQQVATLLGTSYYADIYLLFYQIIWFTEIILITGAMMPTLVATAYKSSLSDALDTVAHALCAALCVTATFGVILCAGLYFWVDVTLPNMTALARTLLIELAILGVLVPVFLCLSNFLSTINRLIENGSWYSTTLVIINIATLTGLIITYTLSGPSGAVKGSIMGLYAGAGVAIFLQLWAMPREVRSLCFSSLKNVRIRRSFFQDHILFWNGTLALISVAAVQEFSVLIDLFFASTTGEGGIGMIGYASRLTMLVNMLFVATPMILLEPRWSFAIVTTDKQAASSKISQDLGLLISLLIAPFVVLSVFPNLVSNVIYNSHLMDPSFRNTLNLLIQIYSLSVFGFAGVLVLSRLLVMHGLSTWLLRASVIALITKIIQSTILINWVGLPGLAISTFITLALQATIYLWVLRRHNIHPLSDIKIGVKVIILGGFIFGLGYWIGQLINIPALTGQGAKAGVLLILSAGLFSVTMIGMHVTKIRNLKSLLAG